MIKKLLPLCLLDRIITVGYKGSPWEAAVCGTNSNESHSQEPASVYFQDTTHNLEQVLNIKV